MGNSTRSKGDIAKKIIKIVFKIGYQLLILMCLLLILIIAFQRVTDSNRSIAGYRIFRVITGSMEPEYDIGQVVICKETDMNKIQVGDDIVYSGIFGDYNGKIIMHEVNAIDKDENGNNVNFHAKGLHSASVEDPEIKPNQIFGVVKHKSGILTLLYNLATSIYSAFIIVTILVLNVFVSFKLTGKNKTQQLEPADDEEYDDEYDNDEYIENEEIEEIIDTEDEEQDDKE